MPQALIIEPIVSQPPFAAKLNIEPGEYETRSSEQNGDSKTICFEIERYQDYGRNI